MLDKDSVEAGIYEMFQRRLLRMCGAGGSKGRTGVYWSPR